MCICIPTKIVNMVFIGYPGDKEFIVADAGMPKSSENLLRAARERFGEDSRARSILLTHGHFDHVGSVIELAEEWDCPIYAHPEEMPYVTGKKGYPTPDATVEGGMVAKLSPTFPVDPIDLESWVMAYPEDGTVPHLPEFQWIHVPGHTPGQVALFREKDRLLLSADAFVSTKQEKLYQVATQQFEINGPPAYLTTDWEAAKESVIRLQQLKPEYAVTGHGPAARGEDLQTGLERLVERWEDEVVPDHGRFVEDEE
ncbi:MBL fold metallo-hydrolase [Atopococcus tabaci]|uniref:MBL fold metallo-hydrolase n=1 Tax=Atopococcus tabaci TaxID=269774 RepID=UPI0024097052|nr:MBL fold metallo-hydrolase [Atopococcus tabaci]